MNWFTRLTYGRLARSTVATARPLTYFVQIVFPLAISGFLAGIRDGSFTTAAYLIIPLYLVALSLQPLFRLHRMHKVTGTTVMHYAIDDDSLTLRLAADEVRLPLASLHTTRIGRDFIGLRRDGMKLISIPLMFEDAETRDRALNLLKDQ